MDEMLTALQDLKKDLRLLDPKHRIKPDIVLVSMTVDRIAPGVFSPEPGIALFESRKPFHMYDDTFLRDCGIIHRADPINNNTETHTWSWDGFVFKTVTRGMNQIYKP